MEPYSGRAGGDGACGGIAPHLAAYGGQSHGAGGADQQSGTDGKNLRCPATGGHSGRGYGGLHGREPGRAAVRRAAGIFVSGQPAFTGACVPVRYPVYAAFAAVYRPGAGRATGGAAAGAAPVFCRIGHV